MRDVERCAQCEIQRQDDQEVAGIAVPLDGLARLAGVNVWQALSMHVAGAGASGLDAWKNRWQEPRSDPSLKNYVASFDFSNAGSLMIPQDSIGLIIETLYSSLFEHASFRSGILDPSCKVTRFCRSGLIFLQTASVILRIIFQSAFVRAEEEPDKAMLRGIKTDGLQHAPDSSIVYGTSDGTNIALECTSIAFVADGQKTKRCESEYKMETLKGTFGFFFAAYFSFRTC